MTRKSGRIGRQKKRASAEAKENTNQTQPTKVPTAVEVPEWFDQAVEDARDIMDRVLAELERKQKLRRR